MTTTTKCVPDITVSVCGPDEIRLTDSCNQVSRQKYIRVIPESRNFENDWTWEELLNIGALLHEAPEFKTETFKLYIPLIVNLGYTLVHNPTRQSVVSAILKITNAWYNICANDENCYPPPSRKSLQDPHQQKTLRQIDELQRRLINEAEKRAVETKELGPIYDKLLEESRKKEEQRNSN